MSQKLRGFVAQKMAAAKADFRSYGASYPPGSFTWIAPKTGYYRFAQWGAGGTGAGSQGGASGSHTQTVRHLRQGQTVAVVVPGLVTSACTCTFPDGSVVTAGSANGVTAGAASGGDINLAGSVGVTGGANGSAGLGDNGGSGGVGNGSTDGGGAGAPGFGGFRGGNGATVATPSNGTPGGGSTALNTAFRGTGLVIIVRQNGLIA